MTPVDTLIHARWLIPVDTETVLDNYSLAIRGGEIAAIVPQQQARAGLKANETLELPDHALIPGFVNAHTHAAMSLFRGLADDLPLMDWLQKHIWPAEAQWVGPEFMRDGVALSIAEMIRGGTTCFNDMYFFPNETARAAKEAGMRACIGLVIIDFPTAWAQNADEYIDKGLALHDKLRRHGLAPRVVSSEPSPAIFEPVRQPAQLGTG